MSRALLPDEIANAFLAACRAELTALKPGNVHVHAAGHGMDVSLFEAAAVASAPIISDATLGVGESIHRAVDASMTVADCNTNLGILLLCVPIAAAASAASSQMLGQQAANVIRRLDLDDANQIFEAIRRANPGGLGRSEKADVGDAPTMSIQDAMALAAPRDRIAANYVSGFADIFDDHLPLLTRIKENTDPRPSADDAVATLYMSLLARFPDSHIRRKFGMETAAHVQRLARATSPSWQPIVTPASYRELLALDALLKTNGWNPGTTADFVVASLFSAEIERFRRE